MQTVAAPEQSAQFDPNETTDADLLAEATLAMIAGDRNLNTLSDQQRATFDKLTLAQATEEKPVEEPKPETPVEVPTEEPAPETEVAEPETPTEETEPETPEEAKAQKGAPSRFRFKEAEDRAVAQLALAKGISLVKAATLYAKLNEPEPKPAEPEPEAKTAVVSPTVQALEAEVAQLETQMDGFVDGIHTVESIKVTREHARKVAQLERARMEAEQSQAAETAFEDQRNDVMLETVKTFPDMANKASAQYLVAARLADEATNPKHPDYKAGCSLDAPRFFAQKAADLLKLKPATAPNPAANAPAKVAAVKTPAKPSPASGTRATQAPPTEKPEADQLAEKLAGTLDMISGGGRGQAQTSTILIN